MGLAYGVGMHTSSGDNANYGFEQPSGSALLTIRPTRRLFMVRGGFEASRWDLKSGKGTAPSVDEVYTPESLPGLGTTTTFLHTQATVGFDSRSSKGYARRGCFYGVTGHDYTDRDDALGFRQVDYEVIQHIPILRETWVISLHGLAKTTWDKGDQEAPFYLQPSVGGGSSLRGFASSRFTDRHSLLLQAEWRIMGNRFFESAVFYDAGKVAARTSDLDLKHLKSDYGFGLRFHAPSGDRASRRRRPKQRRHPAGVCRVTQFLVSRATVMRMKILTLITVVSITAISGFGSASATNQRFYRDDPIVRDPEPQDAGGAALSEVDLMYELTYNLFALPRHKPSGVRAQNVNTIDELPDSSWFTNRVGTRALTVDELVRGPNVGSPPDPSRWVIFREKTSGGHAGITAKDANGQTWFLEFDPPYYPEAATASVVMATKFFWAFGYNQVESFLTTFDPKRMEIHPEATFRRPNGKRTPITRSDIDALLEHAARRPDGTYRVVAGKLIPGRIIGNFRYQGRVPTIRTISCRMSTAASCVASSSLVRGRT